MELASLAIRIARSENLPILPQVIVTIIRKMSDPNCSLHELEKAIEQDPTVVSKVLRVANSAYYGLRVPVSTLGGALRVLGLKTMQGLVLGVAYQQASLGGGGSVLFDKKEFWKHSVASAIAARNIGTKLGCKGDELYMIALLHDLGMMALDRYCPSEFDRAIAIARKTGESLSTCEQQILGFSSADVGLVMAVRWRLGEVVTSVLQYIEDPSSDPKYSQMTSIVSLANSVAHQAGFGNQTPESVLPHDPTVLLALDFDEESLQPIIEGLKEEVARASEGFKLD